jgi:hypothetical protein
MHADSAVAEHASATCMPMLHARIVLHAHGPKQLQEARCLRCNPHVEGNSLLVSNACSTVTHASVALIIILHYSTSGKLAAAAAAATAACAVSRNHQDGGV